MMPKVILAGSQTQVHRENMKTYALIWKFMGIWPNEKLLRTWFNYVWKPKGEVDLHLVSKGFFIVLFSNIEGRDRIFEGGPYFLSSVGLYMQPWKENFTPKQETFTSIPLWIKIYSLPLEYWLPKTLEAIGNSLGDFLKLSEATQ